MVSTAPVAPSEVAGHGFRGTHPEPVGMIPEYALDGERFNLVVRPGRRSVRVEVVHLFGENAGLAERHFHGKDRAGSVRVRLDEVMGIRAQAESLHLRQNLRSPRLGLLQIFEDHDPPGPFADHEPVAARVEGAAGLLWGIVSRREKAHGATPPHREIEDANLRSPGHHHIGVPSLDAVIRKADGMGSHRAGRARAFKRTPEIPTLRHIAGRHVSHQIGNEARAEGAPPLLLRGALQGIGAPLQRQPHPHVHPDSLPRAIGRGGYFRVRQRLCSRGQGELNG